MSSIAAIAARTESINAVFSSLSSAAGLTAEVLGKKCDDFLESNEALRKTIEKYAEVSFGKLVTDGDAGKDMSRTVQRIIVSTEIFKREKITVNLDGVISVDYLTISMILLAISTTPKTPASIPVAVPSNFMGLLDTIPALILGALKTSVVPWKAISVSRTNPAESVQLRVRHGNVIPDCDKFMAMQLLQTFSGANTRTIVKYLNDRANELGDSSSISPLAEAFAVNANLTKLNRSGRFHPGLVTTICGNVGTASCALKGMTNFGTCCGKHLPMGLALIPTGPFCLSHVSSGGPASGIALHVIMTLYFLHICSVVFAARGSNTAVHQPMMVSQLAQGYTQAGNGDALSELIHRYADIDEDVQSASVLISTGLGLFNGDESTIGSLSTVNITNGITANKATKPFPQFIQQCIAGRGWYLRMLNLINGGEQTYNPNNFTRENIVKKVFGSSVLLAMMLNFNINDQAVSTETAVITNSIFPNVSAVSVSEAAETLQREVSTDAFIEGLVERGCMLPATKPEAPVKLEALYGVSMVKQSTVSKIPVDNVIVYVHGAVVYGTGFVAAPRATKAVGDLTGNSKYFQTPAEELQDTLHSIEARQASKPPPKRATKATTSTTTKSVSRAINVTVPEAVDGDASLTEFLNYKKSTTPTPSATPAPTSELRDALREKPAAAAAPAVPVAASAINLDEETDFD